MGPILLTNIFFCVKDIVHMVASPAELECVSDPRRAAVLLAPPRLEILARAREPVSATGIAEELGLARQKVNYHVRQLAQSKFLCRAGRRKKRNMIEQRYVASARSYVLSPEIVAPLEPDLEAIEDKLSAAYLLASSDLLQLELSTAMREAAAQGKRLATLSINSAVRFESAAQRARFARELQEAVAGVIARHAAPLSRSDGSPGKGRPYRLTLGCYPIPSKYEK